MYVLLGTEAGLEGYRDPTSDTPEVVRYKDIAGQTTVQVDMPGDWTLQEAFNTVLLAVPLHIRGGVAPVWIESDSDGLTSLLTEHFQMTNSTRPANWGEKPVSAAAAAPAPTPGDVKK